MYSSLLWAVVSFCLWWKEWSWHKDYQCQDWKEGRAMGFLAYSPIFKVTFCIQTSSFSLKIHLWSIYSYAMRSIVISIKTIQRSYKIRFLMHRHAALAVKASGELNRLWSSRAHMGHRGEGCCQGRDETGFTTIEYQPTLISTSKGKWVIMNPFWKKSV